MRAVVIGGGPAGITAAKTLLQRDPGHEHFEVIVLEAENELGGTFRWRSYENAELVSSRQLTAFSDFRMPTNIDPNDPKSFGDHISLEGYVKYLHDYVDRFDLRAEKERQWDGKLGRIRLGCKVVHVRRGDSGRGHVVTYEKDGEQSSIASDVILICTGLHVTPAVPQLPGLREAGIESFHSSDYKGRSQVAGKKVMVLGAGETAMDLTYESVMAGATEVTMCHRGGFLSFPKVLNNFKVLGATFDGQLPIDGLITNLFESTYVHKWVRATRLRWRVSDFVIKRVLWVLTGTQAGCNQWVGELPQERLGRAYVFLNKSSKAMPYINAPYKPSWRPMALLASYIDPPLKAGAPSIDLAPWPESVDADGRVRFGASRDGRKEAKRMKDEGKVVKPDVVIFATGYKQEWGWLDESYPHGPHDPRVDVRDICSSEDPSVGFIGFVRPGVGAIPPMAELQAMFYKLLVQGKIAAPTEPPHYRLLASRTARIQYGVDYSTYMSTVAADMGAAPELWELYRTHGFHILFCYCFGASFVTFYRLLGPYKSEVAPGVVRDELYATIARRGVAGNIFMGLIPLVFYGCVNAMALAAELWWIWVGSWVWQILMAGLGKGLNKTAAKGTVLGTPEAAKRVDAK